MSLQSLRDALLDAKKNEITRTEVARQNKLRNLYALTKLASDSSFQLDIGTLLQHVLQNQPPSPLEEQFLQHNDLASGRRFRDESLPLPSLSYATQTSQLNSAKATTESSGSAKVQSPLSPEGEIPVKVLPIDAAQLTPASASTTAPLIVKSTIPRPHTPPRSPHVAVFDDNGTQDAPNQSSHPLAVQPSGTIPSTGSSRTSPSAQSQNEIKQGGPQKEQGKSQSLELVDEVTRGKGRGDNASLPVHNDVASSPSSTAGAYSNSTPKPIANSPDTSPEAEPSNSISISRHEAEQPLVSPGVVGKGEVEEGLNATSPDEQLRFEEAQAQKPSEDDVQVQENAQAGEDIMATSGTKVLSNGVLPATDSTHTEKPLVDTSKSTAQSTHSRSNSQTDVEMQDISMISSVVGEETPQRPKSPQATPTRMRTRMASGAIRQKSISEILGETPKKSPVTPSTPHPTATNKLESAVVLSEKSNKPKVRTVVFSTDVDPTNTKALRNELEGYLALKGASLDPEKDYLRPLFLHQAWGPPRATNLQDLVKQAGKTLSTTDHIASVREQQDYKILRRLYNLQNSNKWSLRQMAKFQDPTPGACHWDYLMDEMKWMRTDFREERKWKLQLAYNLARMCADYHAAPDAIKRKLRVNVKRPVNHDARVIADSFDEPPELIPSTSTDSSVADDEETPIIPTATTTISPSSIFTLDYDQVIISLDPTPASDAILAELPLYDPKAEAAQADSAFPFRANQLVPVSKFVTGKLVPKISGLPRKRSRYEYEQSDDEQSARRHTHRRNKSSDPSPFLSPARRSSPRFEIPPEEQDVALFNPINKHILDRLHTAHAFRPPNEFPMPSIQYFEARPQSQWTWDEDQRLRNCVRKYIYNWSLIAMELQSACQSSTYTSGAERRTPWECFERWVQLEGLPTEMSKTAYFKAYQGRLEQATATLQARAQLAAQQVASASAQTPTQANFVRQRRTSHQPIRVERRRDTRHISMIDAMKKIAKRRENAALRQADNKTAAEMRKSSQSENNGPKSSTTYTPGELSKFRQDKEEKLREAAKAVENQKILMAQRAKLAMQAGQAQAAAGVQAPQIQNIAVPGQAQNMRNIAQPNMLVQPQLPQNVAQNIAQVRMANGMTNGGVNMGLAGFSQAQIQALQQAGRLPAQPTAADISRLAALHQQQQQQRQFQMQLPSQNTGLASAHLSPSNGMQPSQQQLMANLQRSHMGMNGTAGMNGVNGVSMPSATTVNANHIGAQPTNQRAALLQGIIANIQAKYPQLPLEQVQKHAVEQFNAQIAKAQNNALNAAAGPAASAMHNQSLAQQHLGLQAHTNAQLMAYNAAQGSFGGSGSPGAHMANLATTNGINNANGMTMMNGLNGTGLSAQGAVNSPTQMYRNMHAAQQAARLSGSPGMMPARPDSRAGTPNGMVRSASGTSGSPTIGSALAR